PQGGSGRLGRPRQGRGGERPAAQPARQRSVAAVRDGEDHRCPRQGARARGLAASGQQRGGGGRPRQAEADVGAGAQLGQAVPEKGADAPVARARPRGAARAAQAGAAQEVGVRQVRPAAAASPAAGEAGRPARRPPPREEGCPPSAAEV
ncbi:hypothetical protein H4R21_001619, partial [Coemansia helicoidea]